MSANGPIEAKGKQVGQELDTEAKKPKCTCACGKREYALRREPRSQQREGEVLGGQAPEN